MINKGGSSHVQIHMFFNGNYVQVAEIGGHVVSIDGFKDDFSKSYDFYALQKSGDKMQIVELKIPFKEKV